MGARNQLPLPERFSPRRTPNLSSSSCSPRHAVHIVETQEQRSETMAVAIYAPPCDAFCAEVLDAVGRLPKRVVLSGHESGYTVGRYAEKRGTAQ